MEMLGRLKEMKQGVNSYRGSKIWAFISAFVRNSTAFESVSL